MANTRTVGASGADHTSIGAAISWMQSNHNFDTDGIATVEIIDSAEYNENITISGIAGTTSATAYLKLTVSSGNRHSGAAGTGHARIRGSTNGSHVITCSLNHTVIEYLEIQQDSTGSSDEGIRLPYGTSDVVISRCVIWSDSTAGDTDGIYTGNWPASYSVDNCIIYGWNRCGINAQQYNGNSTQTINVDSCTIYDCAADDTANDGGIVALSADAGATTAINVYNTAVLDSNGTSSNDYVAAGTGTSTFTGTNNIDSDGSLTTVGITTGAQQNLTTSDTTQSSGSYFVVNSLTAGSEDLTLLDDASGNLAYGNGTDRSGSEPDSRQDLSLDIAGNARSTTSPSPDIGASEYTVVSGDTNINATAEALTITEQTASIVRNVNVSAATESLAITENQATVSLGVGVDANTESLVVTGNAASIAHNINVVASTEALTITEHQATIDAGGATNINTSTESLVVTGQQAQVGFDVNVIANPESLTVTENQATVSLVSSDVDVAASSEALSITTRPATVDASGATTLTPQDITNIVDALFARVIENGETFAEQMKLIRAEAAGKLSVSGNTVSIRDAADSKDRIVATVDGQGQRTSITTDVS
jgi:hypothetical protein